MSINSIYRIQKDIHHSISRYIQWTSRRYRLVKMIFSDILIVQERAANGYTKDRVVLTGARSQGYTDWANGNFKTKLLGIKIKNWKNTSKFDLRVLIFSFFHPLALTL